MLTLHVTNGDAAAGGLARSGLPGDVLSWRDILHDGPVPPDDDLPAFRQARAAFLASRGWASEEETVVDFEERDSRLEGVAAEHEIVLWFEPDLYDQLQLMQVLARLAAKAPEARARLTIVPADLYLGPLKPEKFPPLFAARRAVRDADLQHGTDAWRAFTAPDPTALLNVTARIDGEITARTYGGDEDTRLPYLASSLRRLLEEYPDRKHGLSRSERQICEALAPGQTTLAKLYQAAHHGAESWTWLGDWSFAWYVQRLSDCARPLVVHTNGTRVMTPGRDAAAQGFWERTVELTPFGQDVVRERADAVAVNGIDRWIGGVRVVPGGWRWDGRVGAVVIGK